MDSTPPLLPHLSVPEAPCDCAALLDALPWGILVLNEQRLILRLNQQAAHWCGAASNALLGQALAQAPLPPALAAALLQLLENPGAVPQEVWLPHTQQWVSLRRGPAPAGQHWVFGEDVTARHQAEATRQRNSQLLLDLEAVAHIGSYEADLTTGSFYFSDGMYRLFGEDHRESALTLEVIDARSHPDDAAAVQQVLDEAVRTRQPYTYRRRIRRADGQWRTLEAHGEVRADAAGHAVQLRGLVQDVTERVQAEQQLRQSQKLLRRTIDSSLDMVQVFEAVRDEQGAVVDFAWVLNNAAAERHYGNVIGQRLLQLNPGVVEEGIFDTFRQVLETGVPDQAERHYVHEQFDGWFHQSVVKLGDGVTTTTHDITKRKQAEQELRQTKQLLQAVLDNSRYVVQAFRAVRDAEGRIVDFTWLLTNQVWRENYGDEMTGQSLLQENPGVVETGLFEKFVHVTETGETIDHEQYYAHEQFAGWFHQTLVKLDDGFVMNTVEITERKQAHEEILRLKDELARQATDRYLALLSATTQGFCLLQLLFDETGQQAVDFRYLELNDAFVQHSGLPAEALGKTVSELVPDLEPRWLETYGRVALTGQPEHLEYHVAYLNHWYDAQAFRMGAPEDRQVGVLFSDTTERRRREQEQTFLLKLSDTLRAQSDPEVIGGLATRLVAEHLHVDRCYLVRYSWERELGWIGPEYRAAGLPPLSGEYRFADFPNALKRLETRSLNIRDLLDDASLSDLDKHSLTQTLGLRGLLAAALRRGEQKYIWCLTAATTQPRTWTDAELKFLENVAERIWAAQERARTEEALRVSEDQFRAVANLVPDLLWRSTPASDTTWYNQQWYEYTGQTPAEAAGYGWTAAIHPDDRAESDRYRTAVLDGVPLCQEHRIRSARGEYRWFQVQARPVHNAQGEITSWLGAATDIHARKQAELAQAASEQRLQTLIANLPGAAVFIVDQELRYQLAEGEALRVAGFEPADFQGRLVRDMAPPDQWPTYRRRYAQALAGQPFEAEHAQGGRTFLTRGVPLPGPGGAVEAVLAVSYDITARKQAEVALRLSEEKFRTLADTAPALIWFNNEHGENQFVNQYFLDYIGHTPENVRGLTWHTLIHPDDAPAYLASYQQAVQAQRRWQNRARVRRHDGAWHWFENYAKPLFDNEGRFLGHVGISADVTAIVRAEDALRASEEKYRTLFETMDQGFGIGQAIPANEATGQPLDWQWLEVNPQFERLTGLPRAAALSQPMRALVPGLEEIWFERYAHVAATGETVSFEAYWPVLASWFDVYVFAVGTPDGRRVAVLFTNTTERRRAETALREAEARYREQLEQQVAARTHELQESRDLLQTVFDTNLIAMSVTEAVRDAAGAVQDFRLRLVNRELERQTNRRDLVGRLYLQEYPGIREVGIYDLLLRTLATGEPQNLEYHYEHEGFDHWFASQFVKLGDGVVATNLDITERKTAEQERLRNLRLLEQAEAVAGLGSWDYDLATGTMRWSEGMYQLFGLPVGSPVEPSHYLINVLKEDRARAEQLVGQLTAGEGFEETLRLRVGEQVKTVRLKAVVQPGQDGQPARVLGVDLDISELQRLESDNLRLRLTQQRALFAAVQAAQEAERKKIAEGLHNGIGQILYATKLRLDQLHAPLLGTDPVLVAARQEADQLLAEAIRQTRALSHELVPMVLAEFGLAAAFQDISHKLNQPPLHFHSHVLLDDEADALAPTLQLALYRMAQELGQNVVKHAQGATEAQLELETMPGWVLLRAEDNGPGFATSPDQSAGLGLRSIRDRVALLGGQLETGNVPTGGAYVRIRIPISLSATP